MKYDVPYGAENALCTTNNNNKFVSSFPVINLGELPILPLTSILKIKTKFLMIFSLFATFNKMCDCVMMIGN